MQLRAEAEPELPTGQLSHPPQPDRRIQARAPPAAGRAFTSYLMRSGGVVCRPVLLTATRMSNGTPTNTSVGACMLTVSPGRRRTTESAEIPSKPSSALPTTCIHTLCVWTASANIKPAPATAAHPFGVICTRRTPAVGTTDSATDRDRDRGQAPRQPPRRQRRGRRILRHAIPGQRPLAGARADARARTARGPSRRPVRRTHGHR